jgi:uncharacterized LabA/DUF88 family protein
MSKKNCLLLIDGSNFFFKLKDLKLHNLLSFNFKEFAQKLGSNNDFDLKESIYYVGRVKTGKDEKAQKLFSDQRKLLARLKKHNYTYSLGYLMKSGKEDSYHEKGVDVQIALDILTAAYEKKFKKIILVSSDTDLIPAVKKALDKGLEVEYVGFKHLPSRALINNCSSYKLLSKEDIEGFLTIEKPRL